MPLHHKSGPIIYDHLQNITLTTSCIMTDARFSTGYFNVLIDKCIKDAYHKQALNAAMSVKYACQLQTRSARCCHQNTTPRSNTKTSKRQEKTNKL